MMSRKTFSTVCLLGILSLPAVAAEDPIERCLDAVKHQTLGQFVKVEGLEMDSQGIYEIEIRNSSGTEREFLCEAATGRIIETEIEVESRDDPRFEDRRKVDLETAQKRALDRFPGKVAEIEYELESDGRATYEFDIVDESRREMKVEVDATSGEIVETAREKWQIGEEPDEKP